MHRRGTRAGQGRVFKLLLLGRRRIVLDQKEYASNPTQLKRLKPRELTYNITELEQDAAKTQDLIELTPKKLKVATTKDLERWRKQLDAERRERIKESP